jgi:hypothetical protein
MKHKTDMDLINEAYTKDVYPTGAEQRIDEIGALVSGGLQALKSAAPGLLKTAGQQAAVTAGTNVANKVTGGNAQAPAVQQEDGYDEGEDNITDLEPGENITGIKKQAMIQALLDSLDELVSGNTGPDSPCGEREAYDLIEKHAKTRLDEIGPLAAAIPSVVSGVAGMLGGK